MCFPYRFIFMQIKLIFIWKVLHLDSFWNRGTRELGNGLFRIELQWSHLLQVDIWGKGTNWHSVKRLTSTAFKPSSEDNVINLYIVWGLKIQDRSKCHFTDFNCKGDTVLDRSFDLNPPPCQLAMLVRFINNEIYFVGDAVRFHWERCPSSISFDQLNSQSAIQSVCERFR